MNAQIENFVAQLRALGYEPEVRHEQFVVFDYEVPVGKHSGDIVKIALQVPGDWPMSPPSGPFVSPRLLPINGATGLGRPWDAVHTAHDRGLADAEGVWEYWSRPYHAWPNTDRSAKAYLRHLLTLFGEIEVAADDGDQAEAA
ncbi:MAG: hypothetical protein QOF45_1577 [Gaiellaceae bacterium]|jgi:hypothetical protein|nr:hypothetical protein [Gaiellaceae bacterium]